MNCKLPIKNQVKARGGKILAAPIIGTWMRNEVTVTEKFEVLCSIRTLNCRLHPLPSVVRTRVTKMMNHNKYLTDYPMSLLTSEMTKQLLPNHRKKSIDKLNSSLGSVTSSSKHVLNSKLLS